MASRRRRRALGLGPALDVYRGRESDQWLCPAGALSMISRLFRFLTIEAEAAELAGEDQDQYSSLFHRDLSQRVSQEAAERLGRGRTGADRLRQETLKRLRKFRQRSTRADRLRAYSKTGGRRFEECYRKSASGSVQVAGGTLRRSSPIGLRGIGRI